MGMGLESKQSGSMEYRDWESGYGQHPLDRDRFTTHEDVVVRTS